MFTVIEQSTRSWEDDTAAMDRALARHDKTVRSVVEAQGDYVFSTAGDGFCVAFARAKNAVDAAVDAQKVLAAFDLGVVFFAEEPDRDAKAALATLVDAVIEELDAMLRDRGAGS